MILPKEDYLATQKEKLRLGAKHMQELNLQTWIKQQNLTSMKIHWYYMQENFINFYCKKKTFIFALAK